MFASTVFGVWENMSLMIVLVELNLGFINLCLKTQLVTW
jgi:hypothetical protein